jgi:nitrogen fixation protein NifU and related proteins
MNFYKEELLDHFKNPRNYGELENCDIDSQELNPSCGDNIKIQATVKNETLEKIKFTGKGCVISLATASMLIQDCIGKSLDQVLLLDENYLMNLIGIPLGPNRLKCALLPFMALKNGILQYKAKKGI